MKRIIDGEPNPLLNHLIIFTLPFIVLLDWIFTKEIDWFNWVLIILWGLLVILLIALKISDRLKKTEIPQ